MIALKIFAAIVLAILLGGIGWSLTHLRKIKRELNADGAMPKASPRTNFLILLSAVLFGLSGLLIAFLVQ